MRNPLYSASNEARYNSAIIKKLEEYKSNRQDQTGLFSKLFFNHELSQQKIAITAELITKIQASKNIYETFCLLYNLYKGKFTYKTKDGEQKTCSGNDGKLGSTLYHCMEQVVFQLGDEDKMKQFIGQCETHLNKINLFISTGVAPDEMTSLLSEPTRKNSPLRAGDFENFVKSMFDVLQGIHLGSLVY